MSKIKVFYTVPFGGKQQYQKHYDAVLEAIKKEEVEIIATELGNYKTILDKSDYQHIKSPEQEHYAAIKKGIKWADLIILEISHESFHVGHEATLAMLDKKHVLGLSLHKDWQKVIINPYFHSVKYTQYTLREAIREFISKYGDQKLNERLNLFLSANQVAKLDRMSKNTGMNKSELIRNLIDKS